MLLIYLPIITKRSEYIFDHLFRNELGINFNTTTDINVFNNHNEEKINYSANRFDNEFFVNSFGLLRKTPIKKIHLPVGEINQIKVIFPNENCDVGFDIFSAIFFMISRYEEYLPFKPDRYGRFDAEESLAFKNNFLEIPIVDYWVILFKNILQKRFLRLKIKTKTFNAVLTYDIDVAYKYRGRSILRTAGSIAKDALRLDLTNIINRMKTLSKKKKDPYDVYEYLSKTIRNSQLKSVFFFLLGDKSENDRNLHYQNPLMNHLINRVMGFSEIGIHPSFVSNLSPEKILMEKERLETISGIKIIKSRQHFLKLSLPETYQKLISAGIAEDYSMGYGEVFGFRAGTCKSFNFYDLKNEQSTTLKIFPVTWMEVTYKDFLKQTPEESLQSIQRLIDEVKKVNGTFISIWHNNTIIKTKYEKDWFWVHDEMVRALEKELIIKD